MGIILSQTEAEVRLQKCKGNGMRGRHWLPLSTHSHTHPFSLAIALEMHLDPNWKQEGCSPSPFQLSHSVLINFVILEFSAVPETYVLSPQRKREGWGGVGRHTLRQRQEVFWS